MSAGIAPEILQVAAKSLRAALALAHTIQLDREDRWRRIGHNHFARPEVQVFGPLAAHRIVDRLRALPESKEFVVTVQSLQPALGGFVHIDGASHAIGGAEGLLAGWLRLLVLGRTLDEAISTDVEAFLEQASTTFESGKVRFVVTAPIGGLRLECGRESIDLGDGVRILALPLDDQERFTALLNGTQSLFSGWVDTALEVEFDCDFAVSATELPQNPNKFREDAARKLEVVLSALHIIEGGSVRATIQIVRVLPAVWPHLGDRGTSWGVDHQLYRDIKINFDNLDVFLKVYGFLKRTRGKVGQLLQRAARRLRDAESRVEPTDAFLDSIVGLELLLGGPIFHYAMNYAALSPEDGMARFELATKLYTKRNQLAHGSDGKITGRDSQDAMDCLRDALLRLATDFPRFAPLVPKKRFWIIFVEGFKRR
jgi:hypothetical protein